MNCDILKFSIQYFKIISIRIFSLIFYKYSLPDCTSQILINVKILKSNPDF